MKTTNIPENKIYLSRLAKRAARGLEILISKAGKYVARRAPFCRHAAVRKPGYWRGKVTTHDDFDTLPEDIAAEFSCKNK